MKNGKIKIGIIGSGNIAQNAHIPSYLKMEDAVLAGVYDIHQGRSKEVAEKYNMKSYESLDAMLSDDIDAVSICTWNNGHAESAIKACKAGKHVLCEKPMAMTVAEAEEMQKAANANKKVFMMGFVNRFRSESKLINEMRELGNFGDIYYARTTLLRRRGTPLGWFTDSTKSGGGPVIDIGVHILDLSWYLMGRPEPVSVLAQTHYKLGDYQTKGVTRWCAFDTDDLVFNVEDSAAGVVTFKGGKTINFDVSWAINGTADMNTLLYGDKAGVSLAPFTIFGEDAGYLTDNKPTVANENMFDNEIRHFLDCIKEGKEPIATAADGVNIQKILCGIYESAKLGKVVEL